MRSIASTEFCRPSDFLFGLVQNCELNFEPTSKSLIEYNYDPRSVAVGDFNNDQWLDIVVANRAANSISVFLGNGDGTFGSLVIYPTDSYSAPCMVGVGHFNNDQYLDIAVANFGINGIGIFLGLGDGSFAKHAFISMGSSRPIWIHIAHLNNDTLHDIVTANYGTNSISALFGGGHGTFSHPNTYTAEYDSFPSSVISGDFNNDNRLDLAIANYGTSTVEILLASGNGNFLHKTTLTTGIKSHPYSMTVGHFNDDVLLDIAVTNHGTDDIDVFLANGNGIFINQTTYKLESAAPYSISVGDFNRDKQVDLAVTSKGLNNVGILLKHRNGTFSEAKMYSTGSSSSISLSVADFNNDYLLDIIFINNDTNSIGILFGYREGFQNTTTYSTQSWPTYAAFGDLNKDTQLDMAIANRYDNSISVFFGYGNGSFTNQIIYRTGGQPIFVAIDDLNNDTWLDIVVINVQSKNTIGVRLGYSNGSFGNQIMHSTGHLPEHAAVGDFNHDNHLDIVVISGDAKTVDILFGHGNGSFINQTTYSFRSWLRFVAVADFNNDACLDIIVANMLDNCVSVLLGYGNGSFANSIKSSTGNWPVSITVGDLNNDAQLDIVVINVFDNNNINVMLGYGNGTFASSITSDRGPVIYGYVVIADFNGDNQPDIGFFDQEIFIIYGYGNGSFSKIDWYLTGTNMVNIAAIDLNNDYQLDIVMAEHDHNFEGQDKINILLRLNTGALGNGISFGSAIGSRLQYIIVDDFNNDTILDIVVINYGTNSIGILFGFGNGSFREQTTFSTDSNSNPYSIAIGDFNKDKRIDFAVANNGIKNVDMLLGDGTGSFVRQKSYGFGLYLSPTVIAAGDFNHDGQSDIVVAYHNSDHVDILVAYNTGTVTNQTTYLTFTPPFNIQVHDFNNDYQLDIFFLSNVDSSVGILLGCGNRSFENQTTTFPGTFVNQEADSVESNSYASTVGDFNNDDQLDIIVVSRDFVVYRNLSSSNLYVLRVRLGYGNGSFGDPITCQNILTFAIKDINTGDFNNDGRLDVAFIVSYWEKNVGVLLGYGNGSFANLIIYSTGNTPWVLIVNDFNNDNQLDIVTADENEHENILGVFLGYGNGSFANQLRCQLDFYVSDMVVGDFNNDFQLDIVIANKYDSRVGILLGHGNGSFAKQSTYQTSSWPRYLVVTDFNNDKQLDIIVSAGQTKNNIGVLLGYGNGSFTHQITLFSASPSSSIAVGDFDNDTHIDIVISNDDNNIDVLFGGFNKIFRYQMTLTTGNNSRPQSFAIGDFNNDTHVDISVVNSGTDNVGIFLGYGNGSFANQRTYSTGSSPLSIAIGDFNNDSRLDLVVTNSADNNVGVFLGYGNGSFANQTTYSTGLGSQPCSVAVGDFNNDTILDIIVANYRASNVVVLDGHSNGTFANLKEFLTGLESFPFAVAVGDFNNDRKLDFAVTNYGTDNIQIQLQTC